jgi:hypothetical protein
VKLTEGASQQNGRPYADAQTSVELITGKASLSPSAQSADHFGFGGAYVFRRSKDPVMDCQIVIALPKQLIELIVILKI